MKSFFATVILVFWIVLMNVQFVHCEPLTGTPGASSRWGSGWLDLEKTTDFKQGDKLKLKIGGTAENIVVRLLSKGASPDNPTGIDGSKVTVPPNRIVEVTLREDHSNVIQISVHGGSNPWGMFQLGGGNGPATLLSAERVGP